MKCLAFAAAALSAVPATAQQAGHDMSAMPRMEVTGSAPLHGSPDEPAAAEAPKPGIAPALGSDRKVGSRAAPPPPADHAADAFYDPASMAAARALLAREHGGMRFHRVFFNLAEWQVNRGRDSYRWDGEGWYGGDLDRLVVNTEGEGLRGDAPERGEVQALFSHAIGPYFNVQGGVRQDVGRDARRTYATIGLEGLAPWWFEVEGRLFLSQNGELTGRFEATYDQLLTQRLVLQPRVELNFAAQDVPAARIGRGLSEAELGLRLRYEFTRRFAPYVGVSWARATGRSARFARAEAKEPAATSLVLGLRTWF